MSNALSDFVEKMDPDMKDTLKRGLIGAAVGGMGMGGYRALTHKPTDPDESRAKPVISSAILGALLGGAVGGGLPTGLKMLSPSADIPGLDVKERPIGPRIMDRATEEAITHPGLVGGSIYGIYDAQKRVGGMANLADTIKKLRMGQSVGNNKWALVAPLLYATLGHTADRIIKGQV